MNSKQILALIAAMALVLGVFAPIISIPVIGTLNYFNNGRGDGVLVLVFTVIGVVGALSERNWLIWLSAIGAVGLLAFTFTGFEMRIAAVQASVGKDISNNPFKGLANLAAQSIQLQWGWGLLAVGTTGLIASAALREQPAKQRLGLFWVFTSAMCAATIGYFFFEEDRSASSQASNYQECVGNLGLMTGAVDVWVQDNKKVRGSEISLQDVMIYLKGARPPECPDGGVYVFGQVGDRFLVRCTIGTHQDFFVTHFQ